MRCANPACNAETLYYRGGSLYWVSSADENATRANGERHDKLIWLCPRCSMEMVVETRRPAGQQIRPKNENGAVRQAGHCTPALYSE